MSEAPVVSDAGWQPLPANAAITAMYGGAAWGFFLGGAFALSTAWPLLTRLLFGAWTALAASLALWLALVVLATLYAYRLWKSTRWRLDHTGLSLQRGLFWRREILVPRSRVQHLDIERGPIERHYLVATLVVHTAGTRHHALRIAGLADADAVALRDALVPVAALHDDVV
jgi:membrane protein YdbS with pleckstrin-like domain